MNCQRLWLILIFFLVHSHVVHGEKKVTLCHFPPGNSDAPHTISVGEPAVPAHIAHGDRVGACTATCPTNCDDGNLCTSDSCGPDGQCLHTQVSCDDGVTCTQDACDPDVGCVRLPNDGLTCNDGNDCTSNDACTGTECKGSPIAGCCLSNLDCDDGDPCSDDACVQGGCSNTPRNCAVDNKCLAGFCNANANGACEVIPVSCDDSNVCTDDSCDPIVGCTHTVTNNPPEPTEASCADNADNDCDGAVDRADSDCFVCGDGILQPPEECDDGNTNPFDGCDRCIIVDTNPD